MTVESEYRAKILALQHKAELAMKKVYYQYIDNVAKYANDSRLKFHKSFTLRKNELLGAVLSGENFDEFKSGLYAINKNAVTNAWELAGEKTNEAFGKYLQLIKMQTGKEAFSLDINHKALQSFITGNNVESLSSKVWKPANQFRDEMTVHMGIGVANGDSAATISRRTRQYLNKPDALFRRVKTIDKEGIEKWKWSKRALQYNPGRGVYRSAYMNSMRVARTEINQAYFLADQEMWKNQKFVTGYEIVLSGSHPRYDICDQLQGKYPKEFLFTGWHPMCLCTMIPITMSEDNFLKYLKGGAVQERKIGIPANFSNWLISKQAALEKMPQKPYFIGNNQGLVYNILNPAKKVVLPTDLTDVKVGDKWTKELLQSEEQVRSGGKLEDNWLHKIAEKQGFSDTPTLLDATEFDKIEGRLIYRGMTEEKYAVQFKDGDYFGGSGVYGNGTYFAEKRAEALGYAYEKEAQMITAKMPKDFKVIDFYDIGTELSEYKKVKGLDFEYNSLNELYKSKQLTADEAKMWMKHNRVTSDIGRFAAMRGYDAIKMFNEDSYFVVLNRSKLIVRK